MARSRVRSSNSKRKAGLLVLLALLATAAGLVVSSGSQDGKVGTRAFGYDRLVSWEALPEANGPMDQLTPASASEELLASLLQVSGSVGSAAQAEGPPPRPSDAARAEIAKREPLFHITDPHFSFAGIAVDPIRNEVVIAEENLSRLLVYDRLENTPPNAVMSEPKRMIGGEYTFLEYACSVYIDPATGDIYGVNNDTMNWIPVFGRDARGNMAPKRKFLAPHTTFGVVADEEEQELFFTIQDDHAVVVYDKAAKDQDKILRVLQGSRTQLADPHGIALDPGTDLIFVSNWGTNNERPALGTVPGGGAFGLGAKRADFPVGRHRAFPGSGKIQPASITVYRKDAQGDTPPLRIIQGPKTQLSWPTSLAVHPDRGELFVANDTGDSVIIFRTDADGDAAPIRVIKGPKTMIKNPTGVTLDLKNNELWVANFGSHAATVFPVDAEGDVVPIRVIRSGPVDAPSPMLSNPHTVAFDTKREEILVAN